MPVRNMPVQSMWMLADARKCGHQAKAAGALCGRFQRWACPGMGWVGQVGRRSSSSRPRRDLRRTACNLFNALKALIRMASWDDDDDWGDGDADLFNAVDALVEKHKVGASQNWATASTHFVRLRSTALSAAFHP